MRNAWKQAIGKNDQEFTVRTKSSIQLNLIICKINWSRIWPWHSNWWSMKIYIYIYILLINHIKLPISKNETWWNLQTFLFRNRLPSTLIFLFFLKSTPIENYLKFFDISISWIFPSLVDNDTAFGRVIQ